MAIHSSATILLWFITSPYIFIAGFRVVADEGVFKHKFLAVAIYGALMFLAGLCSFLRTDCRRRSSDHLFSFKATELLQLHIPYCGFHLLNACALYTPYVDVGRYLVLSQVDFLYTLVLSFVFLRRRLAMQHFCSAIMGIASIYIFFSITYEKSPDARFFGKIRNGFPKWAEMKGVFYVLGARFCYVLRGVLSKRLLLRTKSSDKPSAISPLPRPDVTEREEEEEHIDIPSSAPQSKRCGGCCSAVCGHVEDKSWLQLARVNQALDCMLYDAEYVGRNLKQTMELHAVGGALVMVPVALLASFFADEAKDGYSDIKEFAGQVNSASSSSSGTLSTTLTVLIGLSLVHFLQPLTLPKLVYGFNVRTYVTLQTLAALLVILWSSLIYIPKQQSGMSFGPAQIFSLLLFALTSQWFMYASTYKAGKRAVVHNIRQVLEFFGDGDAGAAATEAQKEKVKQEKQDKREFTRKMRAVDCSLGRGETNRILLHLLTSQPGVLRSAIQMIPDVTLAAQTDPRRGNIKLQKLNIQGFKRKDEDEDEDEDEEQKAAGAVDSSAGGSDSVSDSAGSKPPIPAAVSEKVPTEKHPPKPAKVDEQKAAATEAQPVPNRIQLAPLTHQPVLSKAQADSQADTSDDEESDDGGDGAFF